MSGFSGGNSGVLRLWNSALATQIGWLVLPAVAGLAGAAAALRRRLVRDPVVVGAAVWFALGAAAYSITAGIVHPYYTASLAPPLALLIGGEGPGLPDGAIDAAGLRVTIPMQMPVESLNAAVATAVMAYELLNQKRKTS